MTKKQFALIVLLWLAVSYVMVCAPSRAAEVGLVQTTGAPTCSEAKQDLLAVSVRMNHLKDEFQTETNSNLRFVIKEEAQAVANLGRKIVMWISENCRDA